MYAIIEDSGTQIKVSQGDVIRVAIRQMPADQASLVFDRVLALGGEDVEPRIGQPVLEGVTVTGDVLKQDKTEQVPVVKHKRRKGYTRRKSHRQDYLQVKITAIQA